MPSDTSIGPDNSDPLHERIRALAATHDCISETDFCLLANITPATAASWRKRGTGPAYVLIGNRYLYPNGEVREYIHASVRKPARVRVGSLL